MAEVRTRTRVASAVANGVTFIAGLAAVLLAVHVAFVILDANPQNSIVELFERLAEQLAPGFGDVFILDSPKRQAAVNYGIAAVCYLVAGQIIARLIRKAE
jgi:hypothetical protein